MVNFAEALKAKHWWDALSEAEKERLVDKHKIPYRNRQATMVCILNVYKKEQSRGTH